jgi:uncharacterized HAD superfamily protein
VKIGFDVDGVIYRMTQAYHLWLNQSYGMSLDPEQEAQTWNWFDQWETAEQFYANLHAGVDAGVLFWEGELYEPQIPLNFRELKAAGHTIHIVTARFSGLVKSSEEATRHFFQAKDLIYDTLTIAKDKTSVPTDIFLEDNFKNYQALEAAGTVSYLVNRPYNMHDDASRRVDTVDEFTGLILEEAWQELEYCSSY